MGCRFKNYKFKSLDNYNKYQYILNNVDELIRQDYSNQLSLNRLLSTFKNVYKITPISLRTKQDRRCVHLRKLSIYFLVKYSKLNEQAIADYFDLGLLDILKFKSEIIQHKKFKLNEKRFFNYLKNDYILARYQYLCFQDEMGEYFDGDK